MQILTINNIDREEWSRLVRTSANGTWFQTPEAFDFFNAQKELFKPFVVGAYSQQCSTDGHRQSDRAELFTRKGKGERLRGVCVGYVTKEKNAIKQYFTRRAIIIGGPALADDATDEEITALLEAAKKEASLQLSPGGKRDTAQESSHLGCFKGRLCSLLLRRDGVDAPIYIETRNFNDYSRWKGAFEQAGFSYQPHLNFHVHTNQSWEAIENNIGKHRKKYIRLSFRDGATIEENPTIEQVRAYYDILLDLYRTKVKMPLQPWSFFEKLYQCSNCKYLLVMFDGQVVGGSICMLLPERGVYEWYACGKDGVFKNIHPSSVTKYAGMKYACDNGYAVFDMMGAGKPDEEYGVRDFKAEFGGELVEYGRFICIMVPLLYKIGAMGVNIIKSFK